MYIVHAGNKFTEKAYNDIPSIKLLDTISSFLKTLMYPAAMGQFRSAADFSRTIPLDPKKLTTLDLNPKSEFIDEAICGAKNTVLEYFGKAKIKCPESSDDVPLYNTKPPNQE